MHALRLPAAAVLSAFLAIVVTVAVVPAGCGPNSQFDWFCLNPVTGKEDGTFYDSTHYVNGMFDPCHCYDPGGEAKSCPISVDAGSD